MERRICWCHWATIFRTVSYFHPNGHYSTSTLAVICRLSNSVARVQRGLQYYPPVSGFGRSLFAKKQQSRLAPAWRELVYSGSSISVWGSWRHRKLDGYLGSEGLLSWTAFNGRVLVSKEAKILVRGRILTHSMSMERTIHVAENPQVCFLRTATACPLFCVLSLPASDCYPHREAVSSVRYSYRILWSVR